MRLIHAIRLIALATVLMGPSWTARAQPETDRAILDRAATQFQNGDATDALALVEGVLAHAPQSLDALYSSAVINLQLGNADAARGRLERLVKLSGNYFAAWELMVQVAQAQGDLARRNEAIERLKISIRSAIDPVIRTKGDFIRDHIRVGDQVVRGVDYFVRGGSDFIRYQFTLGDPQLEPDYGLLLRTDQATTDNLRETALLPQDKQVFHLDLVEPGGSHAVSVYQFYMGEPDYDTVRADVMKILRGEMKPMSGAPGSMVGILKP